MTDTNTTEPVTSNNAAQPVSSALDQACGRLKAAGLRITQPRIAILTALIKRGQPASIEQIHIDLKGTACDLVTVYRCLAAFESLGLVRRCFFFNGTSLYQIQLDDSTVYHVVSTTGSILEPVSAELTKELRAVITKIEAELSGRGLHNVTNMSAFFASTEPVKPVALV